MAMVLIKDDLEDGTEEVAVVETTSKDLILLNFSHQLLVPAVKVVIELVTPHSIVIIKWTTPSKAVSLLLNLQPCPLPLMPHLSIIGM